MESNISCRPENIYTENSTRCPSFDPEAVAVTAQQVAEHLREVGRLDDVAYSFLRATDGNALLAERSFEDCIDVFLEGGAFSMWRYRIVLEKIREGL